MKSFKNFFTCHTIYWIASLATLIASVVLYSHADLLLKAQIEKVYNHLIYITWNKYYKLISFMKEPSSC